MTTRYRLLDAVDWEVLKGQLNPVGKRMGIPRMMACPMPRRCWRGKPWWTSDGGTGDGRDVGC